MTSPSLPPLFGFAMTTNGCHGSVERGGWMPFTTTLQHKSRVPSTCLKLIMDKSLNNRVWRETPKHSMEGTGMEGDHQQHGMEGYPNPQIHQSYLRLPLQPSRLSEIALGGMMEAW